MPADSALAAEAVPGSQKPDAILVVNGLHRSFGGLVAVDVEHLEIQRGVITALIGPNGAGKTTLFNLLTGFDRPDGGSSTFDGSAGDRPATPPASPAPAWSARSSSRRRSGR